MTTRVRQPHLTEQAWQQQVTQLAEHLGWMWMHAERVTVRRRQRDGTDRLYAQTPLTGPMGRGWPDLILTRERVVYAELKAAGGRVTREQQAVLQALRHAGAECYVWRPGDFEQVRRVLGHRRRTGGVWHPNHQGGVEAQEPAREADSGPRARVGVEG